MLCCLLIKWLVLTMPFFTPCNCNGIFNTHSGQTAGVIIPTATSKVFGAFRTAGNAIYYGNASAGSGTIIATASNTAGAGFGANRSNTQIVIDQTLDRGYNANGANLFRLNLDTLLQDQTQALINTSGFLSLDPASDRLFVGMTDGTIQVRRKSDVTVLDGTINCPGAVGNVLVYFEPSNNLLVARSGSLLTVFDTNYNVLGSVAADGNIQSIVYCGITGTFFALGNQTSNTKEISISGKLINSFAVSIGSTYGAAYSPTSGYIYTNYFTGGVNSAQLALVNPTTRIIDKISATAGGAGVILAYPVYAPNKGTVYAINTDGSFAYEFN